jgi:hypothetical protein
VGLLCLAEQKLNGWVGSIMGGSSRCTFEILTKWLALTRLETRTKESNIYASNCVVSSIAERN